MATKKLTKTVKYGVHIHNIDVLHRFDTKSGLTDDIGYHESSSIKLSGDLWIPEFKNINDTIIEFMEDQTGILDRGKAPSSVGEAVFKKKDGLFWFYFLISSSFFDRISSSLYSGKIDDFIAEGEKLTNNSAEIFNFDLESDRYHNSKFLL